MATFPTSRPRTNPHKGKSFLKLMYIHVSYLNIYFNTSSKVPNWSRHLQEKDLKQLINVKGSVQ